jgi:hypothetical protein
MALMGWATHMLQWWLQRECKGAIWSQSFKSHLSSDWGLQLAPMKLELLVIADQHAAVNTFSGLVHTARQAMEVVSTRIW